MAAKKKTKKIVRGIQPIDSRLRLTGELVSYLKPSPRGEMCPEAVEPLRWTASIEIPIRKGFGKNVSKESVILLLREIAIAIENGGSLPFETWDRNDKKPEEKANGVHTRRS